MSQRLLHPVRATAPFLLLTLLFASSPAWSGEALPFAPAPDFETPAQAPHLTDHSTRTTLLVVTGLGVAAVVSHRYDNSEDAARFLDRAGVVDPVVDFGNWYGNGVVLGAATVGAFVLGKATGHDGLRSFGRDAAEALVLSGAATAVLKVSVDSKRPDGGRYSFPSGHTAAAFSVAPVIQRYYGTRAGIVAYTAAVLTGLGRVEDHRHYLADVLAGAAIGIAAGRSTSSVGGFQRLARRLTVSKSCVGLRFDF